MTTEPQPSLAPTLGDIVDKMSRLPYIRILDDHHLAEAMTKILTDHEFSTDIGEGEPTPKMERWQDVLREEGNLPPALEDPVRFAKHYARLRRFLPYELERAVSKLPPNLRTDFETLAASDMCDMLLGREGNLLEAEVGVQVERSGSDSYTLRTVGGMVCELARRSETVVEYGPGVLGGFRRMKELAADTWTSAVLLENNTYPIRIANRLAALLGVDPSRFTADLNGMKAGAESLAGQVQRGETPPADLVIAARIRKADPQEVSAAIHAAPRLGSALLVNDYEPRHESSITSVHEMLAWATEAFGPPVHANTTSYRVGEDQNIIHEALFIKS